MAFSPASERRARLIREMAQELNSTRHSLKSNSDFADLTGSHLSVEEESSQPYRDQSHPLPALNATSRTSTRLINRPSADFMIDSSAIGRAFPDMTGSASSVDDGSSISIELGRGLRAGDKNLSLQDEGSIGMGNVSGQYKIDLNRLPHRSQSTATKPSSLREVSNVNDPILRSSPPPFKSTAYGTSGSSRESSGEHLAKHLYQATVEDGSHHSNSNDGQQSTQNLTVRSSRFSHGQSKSEFTMPKRYTSGKDLLRDVHHISTRANSSHKLAKPLTENPTVTTTNGGTAQSFLLPNMPNMSELVSGVYDDGTPVFSRTTAGRFQQPRHSSNLRPVQSLPVPQDEEAIMMSLRLLQEKVQQLERNKAEAEVLVKELQNKKRALEDEKRELKRARKFSGGPVLSGTSDDGEDGLNGTQSLNMDKRRMQSTIRNLQNELDGANRRAAVAEANAINISAERDSAIAQLGVAFVTQEELKVDNENLRSENRRLGMEVQKYRVAIETYIQRAESERTETKSKVTEEESGSRETQSVDCQILDVDTPRRPTARRDTTKNTATDAVESEIHVPKRRKRRVIVEEYTATSDFQGFDDETIERIREASRNLSQNVSRNVTQQTSLSKAASKMHTQNKVTSRDQMSTKQTRPASRAAPARRDETAFSNRRQEDTKGQRRIHTARIDDDDLQLLPDECVKRDQAQDLTRASRVSFLHEGDVTILRKMLEKEHLEKKGRVPSNDEQDAFAVEPNEHQDITQLTNRSRMRPQKSSMKESTEMSNVRKETTAHTDIEDEEQIGMNNLGVRARTRRYSEGSMASQHVGKRRNKSMEDVTSAFILPDITMNVRQRRQSQGDSDATDILSIGPEMLQQKEDLHEAQNCTICTRHAGTCDHDGGRETEKVKIPTPILASERIKDLALDGEDHTTRPSEPPAEALARTIKALEDEFAHLGMQLAALQQQYNELDPSLQKRKRKSMGANIDSVRAAMDAKGDQVYALYDVLEGQRGKDGGLERMTAEEVNDTLSSILGGEEENANMNMGNLGMPSGIMFRRGQKTSSADVTPAKERARPRRMSIGGLSEISERTERTEGTTVQVQGARRSESRLGVSKLAESLVGDVALSPVTAPVPARTPSQAPAPARTPAASVAAAPAAASSTPAGPTPSKKFPWDESYDDEEDVDSLSWQGFDDTLDITRASSQKSNTSSKRRGGATATLEL